jgi:HD superfamily phosphohydrolase
MILRDPVHGLVAFERPEEQTLVRLLETREVQRLRRVRMLGVTSLAFPGAEHSRFAHAVGSAHVMRCFLARMRALASDLPSGRRLGPDDERLALAAALVHDLGHGPLSHLFEEVFENAPRHEWWTSALLLDPDSQVHQVLAAIDSTLPGAVERLVHGEHAQDYLAHAVSGTFDVDRCDYLLRDSYMTGVRYGLYDLDWLLRSLRLAPTPHGARLAVDGSKGLPAVEGFFLARLFMYQQVYFHKAARAAEWMIRALFARAVDLLREGREPEGMAPVLRAMARGESVSPTEYGSLDDGSVWGTIERWEHAQDPVLQDLAARLRRRALFKTATLDEEDAERADELLAALREVVAEAGLDPRYYVTLDVAQVTPYEEPADPDEALQVVYQHRPARPLGRASFLIGKLQGETIVHRRLVFPGEVREKVQALLRRDAARSLAEG